MPPLNLATIEIKAFVPTENFEQSLAFYKALGFTCASIFGDVAYLHCGNSSFLLQRFFVREHAENFQMHLLVENVDDWHVKAKAVAEEFEVNIGDVEDRPWGMRDFVLFDPSGVLWRIGKNAVKKIIDS